MIFTLILRAASKYAAAAVVFSYPVLRTLILTICFALIPVSEGFAQLHCQPYWTEAYKRAMGCLGGGGTVQQQPYVPSAAKRADNLNSAGVAASNARDFARAASLFEQALSINPNDAAAAVNLRNTRAIMANQNGVQAFKAGNYPLAVSLFEQALRINPNDAAAANNLRMARASMTNSAPTTHAPPVNATINPKEVRALALTKDAQKASAAGSYALAVKLYAQAVQLVGPNADMHIGAIIIKDGYAANLAVARAALANHAAALKDAPSDTASKTQKKKKLQVVEVTVVAAKKVGNDFVCPPQLPQYHFAPLRNGHPDAHTCWPVGDVFCQSPNKVWSCPAGKGCGDPEAGANGQLADLSRKCR